MRETLRIKRTGLLAASVVGVVLLCPGSAAAQSHTVAMPPLSGGVRPEGFGLTDETRTVISATAFYTSGGDFQYATLTNLGRFCTIGCTVQYGEYYATLNLPAGAVIDYIGLNSANDTDAIFGVALWQRDRSSTTTLLAGFSVPAHDWDTDFAGPLGIQITDHVDKELVLNVEQATSPNLQYFGWVEVWWHRTVSPAAGDGFLQRRADEPPVLPVHRGAESVRDHGRMRGRYQLLPGQPADARPNGGVPVQGARPALAELSAFPAAARHLPARACCRDPDAVSVFRVRGSDRPEREADDGWTKSTCGVDSGRHRLACRIRGRRGAAAGGAVGVRRELRWSDCAGATGGVGGHERAGTGPALGDRTRPIPTRHQTRPMSTIPDRQQTSGWTLRRSQLPRHGAR